MGETVAEEKLTPSTNPLCNDMFRSLQFIEANPCGQHGEPCKPKQPLPKEKIYDEKTIEVGVFIDRHLYKNMEEALKTPDEGKVKEQLLRMVHNLFLQVEAFLTNPTFTSKGGFKIMLNGIRIYQNHGPLESEWDM